MNSNIYEEQNILKYKMHITITAQVVLGLNTVYVSKHRLF